MKPQHQPVACSKHEATRQNAATAALGQAMPMGFFDVAAARSDARHLHSFFDVHAYAPESRCRVSSTSPQAKFEECELCKTPSTAIQLDLHWTCAKIRMWLQHRML